jgi:hypothetical protein
MNMMSREKRKTEQLVLYLLRVNSQISCNGQLRETEKKKICLVLFFPLNRKKNLVLE